MALIPEDLRYSKNHMWVRLKDGEAVIGMTDHAQEQTPGITYMRIPSAGSHLAAGEVCGPLAFIEFTCPFCFLGLLFFVPTIPQL